MYKSAVIRLVELNPTNNGAGESRFYSKYVFIEGKEKGRYLNWVNSNMLRLYAVYLRILVLDTLETFASNYGPSKMTEKTIFF